METASRRCVGRGGECLLAPLAYFLPSPSLSLSRLSPLFRFSSSHSQPRLR
ncbi:hypothetical protein OIU79_023926, partial [Salix purpurea]